MFEIKVYFRLIKVGNFNLDMIVVYCLFEMESIGVYIIWTRGKYFTSKYMNVWYST